MRFRLKSARTACIAIALSALAAACSSSPSTGSAASSGPTAVTSNGASVNGKIPPPREGGSITVLEGKGYSGDWPFGLDPATNTDGAADQDLMTSVYGQLFELGPTGKIIDDLATGYSISPDAKTITIDLRHGVKFTDGTPFNAKAVAWNFTRDFETPCTCSPTSLGGFAIARTNPKNALSAPAPGVVTTPGPYTVQVKLLTPDSAFIDQTFDSILTWIASPTAYQKMGEKRFAQYPVGAGPFTVVSDTYSDQAVLKKNPGYWQAGRPYLNQITFKSVASDEAAYEAMLAGQGQVYPDMSTTQLLNQAAKHFTVLTQLGTSPYDLQLNTAAPPFNNIKAREAIYAATNFTPILAKIFGNKYPVAQGFTGPGGLCYQQMTPGYQGYNATLAKQLVAQSGLSKYTFTLGTIANEVAQETTEALQTEWAAFGIHTKIASYPLAGLIQAFTADGGKGWSAMIQTDGAYDPAGGVSVNFRFGSKSPFSGVHDPKIDNLLEAAVSTTNLSARCHDYNQVADYIAKMYYGPFYFSFAPANVSVAGVVGPGLTQALPATDVTPTIPWEDVYYNPSTNG